MAILPLRKLGSGGVITDVDGFELPPEAFGFAKNVRIENSKTMRGSVFRTVGSLAADPAHLMGFYDSTGTYHTFYADTSGKIWSWTPSGETDITTAGWTPSVVSDPHTSVIVNNMLYVNRDDHVPWVRSLDGVAAFTAINTGATQWDSTYRAKVIRGMNAMVVAFNITKGTIPYPTMVKWSGFTSFNAQPGDWDITSTTSSAGENPLDRMKGPILDAQLLKDRMMIYGSDEVWSMDYIGGNDIFAFDRLFDFGVLNQNCVVEHEGLHYVFGNNDIKKTDGISSVSIADGRVRRFIYDTMDLSQSNYFFAAHSPVLNEVIFCYVSNDPYLAFPSVASLGCNRAAIYNYADDVWYFADMPYVTSSTLFKPGSGTTWDLAASTWDSIGGSWSLLDPVTGSPPLTLTFAGPASSPITRSLRTFDRPQSPASTYPVDANANAGAYLERDDVDFDAIRASLRGYKLVSSIYPQGVLDDSAAPLRFAIGFSDHSSVDPQWGLDQTFDRTQYKLDYNMAGRFMSYRMNQDDFQPFDLTGFDADITLLGEF